MCPGGSLLSRTDPDELGLPEVVAMDVGGMVSGSIYAVLGVAMRQAGNAVPLSYLLVMGGLTAAFAALGKLAQVTEFGSVAFLASFAVTNYTNLRLADETGSHPAVPALGLLGTAVAVPVVLYHLYRTDVASSCGSSASSSAGSSSSSST